MQELDVLFSEMTPAEAWEAEFNSWYDEEHIPVRMELEGFAGAQRYKRNERDYLAVYDLASVEALETPSYQQLKNAPSQQTERMLGSVAKFSRYIGRGIGSVSSSANMLEAPVLYAVFFEAAASELADFDAWYALDHVPILMECEDWLGCRRFELTASHPHSHNRLALHYLAREDALRSEARLRARNTPWRQRLSEKDWFKPSYLVFEKHGERFVGSRSTAPSENVR